MVKFVALSVIFLPTEALFPAPYMLFVIVLLSMIVLVVPWTSPRLPPPYRESVILLPSFIVRVMLPYTGA